MLHFKVILILCFMGRGVDGWAFEYRRKKLTGLWMKHLMGSHPLETGKESKLFFIKRSQRKGNFLRFYISLHPQSSPFWRACEEQSDENLKWLASPMTLRAC